MKPNLTRSLLTLTLIAVFAFSAACTPSAPAPTLAPSASLPPSPTIVPPTEIPPTQAPPTAAAPTDTPAAAPTLPSQPPEPQKIEFQAEDGQKLEGSYYPAAAEPAPLIVLMHWAGGNQYDWVEIACWLQNRSLGGKSEKSAPWLDPSWFPPVPQDQSIAVFTFTFRGCENGCQSFDRAGWLKDARAAMLTARGLPGVDPNRIIAAGASIGADGAPDGCQMLNSQFPNSCLGAFSFSPGGYLTVPYASAVKALGEEQPAKPVWCLAAEQDAESIVACNSASGEHYQKTIYPSDLHGMMLIQSTVQPSALQLLLDFIALTLKN